MKSVAIFVVALLLAAGIVYARDYEVQKKVGGYDIVVRFDRNPPVAGGNNIEVTIRDQAGYVTDAKVTVNYTMPPMPGMAPMNYKADAQAKGNVYTAKVDFSMSGPWGLEVRITGRETVSARFTIDVK